MGPQVLLRVFVVTWRDHVYRRRNAPARAPTEQGTHLVGAVQWVRWPAWVAPVGASATRWHLPLLKSYCTSLCLSVYLSPVFISFHSLPSALSALHPTSDRSFGWTHRHTDISVPQPSRSFGFMDLFVLAAAIQCFSFCGRRRRKGCE
jgi:hypothetical protein